jgi:hypothetical protein
VALIQDERGEGVVVAKTVAIYVFFIDITFGNIVEYMPEHILYIPVRKHKPGFKIINKKLFS